jgi:chromosomal replication initiator protein
VNNLDARQLWQQVLDQLRAELGDETLDLWLKPTAPSAIEQSAFRLRVPNKFFSAKIHDLYEARIETLLKELSGQPLTLQYVVAAPEAGPPRRIEAADDFPEPSMADLNPRYTFDSFVRGPSNRFAHATAEAIAKNPGRQFNPFFLYGGVGLGKTHLLHAIGHGVRQGNARSRVLYTTAERFVNEYIDSLRYDKPDAFRSKFRNLDCLLIDDIQFLIAKGKSEEEFFHTFNSLFDSRKQIVLTSDRAPKEMTAQETRMISRFEWGVVADIKPPDYETRVAILKKKADDENMQVPEDVLQFIARVIKTNIRELEGALTRVAAYEKVLGTPLSVDLAKELLKDALSADEEQPPVRVETIQKVVAQKYSLEVRDMKGQQRTDSIAFPRQLAMYLACKLTAMSLKQIGEAFGGKDHTTVLHGKKKIELMLEKDPFFTENVNSLINTIKSVDNQ